MKTAKEYARRIAATPQTERMIENLVTAIRKEVIEAIRHGAGSSSVPPGPLRFGTDDRNAIVDWLKEQCK